MNHQSSRRRVIVAAAVTGVGLSGFFDGILLHQVLQWHHLLSLVPGETWRSIENQILADGLFHVLMYAVTAIGLFLLWRARRDLGRNDVGARQVGGGFLLGFGGWNVIDVGLFHWILGIHRIRVDVPEPLAYDLGWLAVLGLVPLALAWTLLRSAGSSGDGRRSAALLGFAALLAAPVASLPPPGTSTALVLFAADEGSTAAFAAAHQAGAPVLWMNAEGTVAAVDLARPGARVALYRAGARLVTRSPALAGCLAALRG
jgi:uncharacterized membrane protein